MKELIAKTFSGAIYSNIVRNLFKKNRFIEFTINMLSHLLNTNGNKCHLEINIAFSFAK